MRVTEGGWLPIWFLSSPSLFPCLHNKPSIHNTNTQTQSHSLSSKFEIWIQIEESEIDSAWERLRNEGTVVGGIRRQRHRFSAAPSFTRETQRLRSGRRFRPLVWALPRGTRPSRQGHWGDLFSSRSNSLSQTLNTIASFRFATWLRSVSCFLVFGSFYNLFCFV